MRLHPALNVNGHAMESKRGASRQVPARPAAHEGRHRPVDVYTAPDRHVAASGRREVGRSMSVVNLSNKHEVTVADGAARRT